jgi:hypothetical protein
MTQDVQVIYLSLQHPIPESKEVFTACSSSISHLEEIDYFKNYMNDVFCDWFKGSKLALNVHKTYIMKFCTDTKLALT